MRERKGLANKGTLRSGVRSAARRSQGRHSAELATYTPPLFCPHPNDPSCFGCGRHDVYAICWSVRAISHVSHGCARISWAALAVSSTIALTAVRRTSHVHESSKDEQCQRTRELHLALVRRRLLFRLRNTHSCSTSVLLFKQGGWTMTSSLHAIFREIVWFPPGRSIDKTRGRNRNRSVAARTLDSTGMWPRIADML